MIQNKFDVKTLREMTNRAYNYRRYIGKDQFKAAYAILEIFDFADTHDIDISDPQKFQNLLTKLQKEQDKIDRDECRRFRDKHRKISKGGKLSKKDFSEWVHLHFAEGMCPL